MSLNINNIYCSQWLINETLKEYCKNLKYKSYFIYPHNILHIKDTINYKALLSNNYDVYHEYVTVTKQKEHSVDNYKNLLTNFDISKMKPIVVQFVPSINKFIIRDGVHRLSILIFKKIINNEVPIKYLNII